MAESFAAGVLKVEEAKKAKIVEFNLGNKKGVGAESGSQLQHKGPGNETMTRAVLGHTNSWWCSACWEMATEEHKTRAGTW